jgi:hypothetical protein
MIGGRGNPDEQNVVASYRGLRRGIGILGLVLPFVLAIGYMGLRDSVSAFYYTDMRNWFVGSMWATGFFLIFYRFGKLDNVLSSVAGVLAILVALFPTTPLVLHPALHQKVIGDLHLTFAAGFLLLLAFFCGFLFTKSGPVMTDQKKLRNKIYRGSGIAITAGVIAAGLFDVLTSGSFRHSWHPVFWCESVAVVAFGVSWLIKGETLFQDKDSQVPA